MSSGSGSSSPRRTRVEKENEKPRAFDSKAKSIFWANADIVPGHHAERWGKDAAGIVVCRRFSNCQGCLCFEYDHIVPISFKANKEETDTAELKGYSCDINFTDKELDIIEMAVYGDVIRPGNHRRCRTVAEMLGPEIVPVPASCHEVMMSPCSIEELKHKARTATEPIWWNCQNRELSLQFISSCSV